MTGGNSTTRRGAESVIGGTVSADQTYFASQLGRHSLLRRLGIMSLTGEYLT